MTSGARPNGGAVDARIFLLENTEKVLTILARQHSSHRVRSSVKGSVHVLQTHKQRATNATERIRFPVFVCARKAVHRTEMQTAHMRAGCSVDVERSGCVVFDCSALVKWFVNQNTTVEI